jgi:hypothetical protein
MGESVRVLGRFKACAGGAGLPPAAVAAPALIRPARADLGGGPENGRGTKGRTTMLRIYTTILEVLRGLRPVMAQIEAHDRDLARQLRRAATSVALNTGEVAPGKAWEEEA